MSNDRVIRIGGAAAHWMDSVMAVPQLLKASLDYIMLDYMSEGAIGVLARMAQMNPDSGFPPDFVTTQVGVHIAEIMAKGVKIVANAGGLNPEGCAEALRKVAEQAGVSPSIAIIKGDDLRDRLDAFRAAGMRDMFNGKPFPEKDVLSANVYLGAFPIAQALRAGADIVITGRVSDSALALGPLIAEFGWKEEDYDLLSAGTLVGHLLECGCHSTGGTFTDWRDAADGWADMGYPIAECRADGSFILTKPEGTGGLVSLGTAAEQMLYEVADPQAYPVADVVCDFSAVTITEQGKDRVLVANARGYPPSGMYKMTVTADIGWRGFLASPIVGFDAGEKAKRQGAAIVERVTRLLKERNLPPFTRTRVDAIGAEATLGTHAASDGNACREVVLRIAVDHPDREGAELFVREQHSAMTSMAVGTTVALAMSAQPITAISGYLVPCDKIKVTVIVDGKSSPAANPAPGGYNADTTVRPIMPEPASLGEGAACVPLIRLAWARSGDKGGDFNVGIIARRPEYLPYFAQTLTVEAVRDWYAHCFDDPTAARVERYFLPGTNAFNFVLKDALGGSIAASNRLDVVAKTMGQQLLAMPIPVPANLAAELGEKVRKPEMA
jgi:hypothetical protein